MRFRMGHSEAPATASSTQARRQPRSGTRNLSSANGDGGSSTDSIWNLYQILRLARVPAFLVDRGDHRRGMLGGGFRQDAVAEVEHVAGPWAKAVQHSDHLLPDTFRAREQDDRIE